MGSPKRRAIFDFGPIYLAIIYKMIFFVYLLLLTIETIDTIETIHDGASEDDSHCAAAE